MVSMYLILTFQDINDKIRYIVTIYGIVTAYGISTLMNGKNGETSSCPFFTLRGE